MLCNFLFSAETKASALFFYPLSSFSSLWGDFKKEIQPHRFSSRVDRLCEKHKNTVCASFFVVVSIKQNRNKKCFSDWMLKAGMLEHMLTAEQCYATDDRCTACTVSVHYPPPPLTCRVNSLSGAKRSTRSVLPPSPSYLDENSDQTVPLNKKNNTDLTKKEHICWKWTFWFRSLT